jgi:CspA family cold shock protein
MIKGTVKFYNEAKGYGFILTESGLQEILVQKTGLKDKIRVGDAVMFETKKSKKGITAVNVKIA